MINFFLHNEAINVSSIDVFIKGLSEFISIKNDNYDNETFMTHKNVWKLPIIISLHSFNGNSSAIYTFIGQTTHSKKDYNTDNEIDTDYPKDENAFLGINFAKQLNIDPLRQITDKKKADLFRLPRTNTLTCHNLWNKRIEVFSHLVFCENVKEHIDCLTNENEFERVLGILISINQYLTTKKPNSFSCGIMYQESKFHMSPESESTLTTYGKERTFITPTNESIVFSYHIKLGNQFRIYIHQVEKKNKLYIGYIGKHLPTKKFN